MNFHIALFLCFISCATGTTQHLYWREHTEASGFNIKAIACFGQDRQGYLWVGGEFGLTRFDGNDFQDFTVFDGLPSNFVQAIATDPNSDDVYFSTNTGLARFRDGRFEEILDTIDVTRIAPFVKLVNEGKLYMGSNAGLLIYDPPHSLEIIDKRLGLESNLVKSVLPLGGDSLMIGTSRSLHLYHDGQMETIDLPSDRINVRQILQTRDGVIWILNHITGVFRYENGEVTNLATFPFVMSIYLNSKDELMVIGSRDIRIFRDTIEVDRITEFPGDGSFGVGDAFVDRQDNIWFERDARVLLQSAHHPFTFYRCQEDSICTNSISAMYKSNEGEMVFGSDYGIYRLEDDALKFFFGKAFFKSHISDVVEADDGTWWAGYDIGGLLSYDGKNEAAYFSEGGLNDLFTFKMCKMQNGVIWVGRREHLVKITNGRVERVEAKEFQGRDLSTLAERPDGALVVGSSQGGLFLVVHGQVKALSMKNHIFSSLVWHEGHLWAGTIGAGVVQIEVSGDTAIARKVFNPDTGYPFIDVYDLVFDHEGMAWVLLFDQLYRLDPDSDPGVGMISFTAEDRLAPSNHQGRALCVDNNNQLWIGSREGAIMLDLEHYSSDTTLPNLAISNIDLFYESMAPDVRRSGFHDVAHFASRENFIRFHYDGIDFQTPSKVIYQHRLEGLESSWSPASAEDLTAYTSLPPGAYTFHVRAANGNGLWTEPLSWSFNIAQPFFGRLWVQLAGLSILGLLVFGYFKWRVLQIRKQVARKSEIDKQLARLEIQALRAQMNPHFIFNALNSIQHLITERDEKAALTYLNTFSKLIRKVLDKATEAKIYLSEEIEMLRHYIELEALRFDRPFEYRIKIEPGINPESVEIPYLILQPVVENAIHHGLLPKDGAGQLDIQFRGDDRHVRVTIEDNGIGRIASRRLQESQTRRHESRGLAMIEERLKLLDTLHKEKRIEITDLYDTKQHSIGTRVEIFLEAESA